MFLIFRCKQDWPLVKCAHWAKARTKTLKSKSNCAIQENFNEIFNGFLNTRVCNGQVDRRHCGQRGKPPWHFTGWLVTNIWNAVTNASNLNRTINLLAFPATNRSAFFHLEPFGSWPASDMGVTHGCFIWNGRMAAGKGGIRNDWTFNCVCRKRATWLLPPLPTRRTF
jgi:hypothetical protein